MKRAVALLPLLLLADRASAHGFGGAGFLHPLTGLDHMLTMVAVGAWSAQLGGRAVWAVPLTFVVAMAIGGAAGLSGIALSWIEPAILASAALVGAVIAIDRRFFLPVAALATSIFGFAHGFAHGAEVQEQTNVAFYVVGFLITTAGLHILGLVGATLVLESPSGRRRLRLTGFGIVGAALGMVVSTG